MGHYDRLNGSYSRREPTDPPPPGLGDYGNRRWTQENGICPWYQKDGANDCFIRIYISPHYVPTRSISWHICRGPFTRYRHPYTVMQPADGWTGCDACGRSGIPRPNLRLSYM